MTSRISYGQCCKNELVTGMSCVRDLYFLACCSKMYCRGNRYITLGLHDIAMVQQEHKYWHRWYWHRWHIRIHFEKCEKLKSICNLPLCQVIWVPYLQYTVGCCEMLSHKTAHGAEQLETVSKQWPSLCQWNLFADHKSFPISFTVVLHFYHSHYNCR